MKNEKGFIPVGGFSAQTVAIITIVAGVFLAGYLGYIDTPWTPEEGGTGIKFGYILADGTHEPFDSQGTAQIYTKGLALYKDPNYTEEITGFYGTLWLKPNTKSDSDIVEIRFTNMPRMSCDSLGLSVTGLRGDWDWSIVYDEIPANVKTENVMQLKFDAPEMLINPPGGRHTITWSFEGTGTIKGTDKKATWSATGTLDVYWSGRTLSFDTGVATSTFEIE